MTSTGVINRQPGGLRPSLAFENTIPFAPLARLDVPDGFKRTELAWKLSVKGDNPILRIPNLHDLENGALPPTGFEPYFLGTGQTPRQTIRQIAAIGAEQLDWLARRHYADEYYLAHVLALLKNGRISAHDPQRTRDIQTLAELDAVLGSLTRTLGYQAETSDPARAYRADTHHYVDPLVSSLVYAQPRTDSVIESYALPDISRATAPIAPAWDDLPTFRLRRGWRFMALLGDRLGNAPVHAGMQGLWLKLPIQYRY
jgi:hypothetical protein